MGNFKKKKYTEGESKELVTRTQALKKLQLDVKNFRRLCILKGIYPREPKNRKQAQKGKPTLSVMYSVKDLNFLAADKLWWDIRKIKTQAKARDKAWGKRNFGSSKYLSSHPVQLDLDHLVKERYPSFLHALRDLDDCLTLLFLFGSLPKLRGVPEGTQDKCRKVICEFLQIVIEKRALRRVFVSIKGYYYQVELRGELITFVVPHYFGFDSKDGREVDFNTMYNFVEFYLVMLGFVNFRLYQQCNLFYPPKLFSSGDEKTERDLTLTNDTLYHERLASLNMKLAKSQVVVEEDMALDTFPESSDDIFKIQKEIERTTKLQTLFNGLKIFINREVPREPVTICVRSLGGEVSWDKTLFVGATFDEDDETITHQIVDRPSIDKQYISRYYVQPQWVFDSVNAARLLPVERYLLGAVLPPHLSPFVDPHRDQRYKPPEELELEGAEAPKEVSQEAIEESDDESEDEEGTEEEEEQAEEEGVKSGADEADSEQEDPAMDTTEKERLKKKKKMAVKAGTIFKEVPEDPTLKKEEEQKLLRTMIRKKDWRIYKSMMRGKRYRMKEVNLLTKKRKELDAKEKAAKKEEKKQRRKTAALLQA